MNISKEFKAVEKAEWLAKVTKDLKGKPLTELDWQVEENLVMQPFYTAADLENIDTELPISGADNDWAIGEEVIVTDAKAANAQVLDALMNGVNAPLFVLNDRCSAAEIEELLNEIELSYISSHFSIADISVLTHLKNKNITGTLSLNTPDFPILAELIQNNSFPNMKCLHLNSAYLGKEKTTTELANVIQAASVCFDELIKLGLSPQQINAQFHVTISVGVSYFLAIAKIRAFKILWLNLAAAYGIENPTVPYIHATTAIESHMNDRNTNMIRTTTQAMSAVVAGVNRLTVTPSDAFEGSPTAFTRRIARNVQHLLKYESYMPKVIDPAKGSYYIEVLTDKLGKATWALME